MSELMNFSSSLSFSNGLKLLENIPDFEQKVLFIESKFWNLPEKRLLD
jgi:hypothetical protein